MQNLDQLAGMAMVFTGVFVIMRALRVARIGTASEASVGVLSGLAIGAVGAVGPLSVSQWAANVILQIHGSEPIQLLDDPKLTDEKPPAPVEPEPITAPEADAPSSGGDDPIGVNLESLMPALGYVVAAGAAILLLAWFGYGLFVVFKKASSRRELARAAAQNETERLDRVWAEAVGRHDTVRSAMDKHQRDIDLVLSLPAINDLDEPKTAAFIEALARAQDASFDSRPESAEAVERYATATRRAQSAWGAALRNADLLSLSKFSHAERTTIRRVRALMAQARVGSTVAERKTYYDRAVSLLANIIELPEPAVAELEHVTRGELMSAG